jgi:3-hydroxyacyl-CoA dehydrogenase/3a,7a,12a-trihydroxy-5b-cholest-24-enoyl-CoA hydratase
MWRDNKRIHFQTFIVETGVPVVTGAYVDLHDIKMEAPRPVPRSSNNIQSNAIFTAIDEKMQSNPELAKTVNGVFLYIITVDGKPVVEWTLDLKNAKVHKGKPKSGKADVTLTVDDKDMVDIALGKLSPQVAFVRGKLKITGNIMLAQKLKGVMEVNKAKL